MIIYRDFNRTEQDDFHMNVENLLSNTVEAVVLYVDGNIVGWKIQLYYE